MDTMPAAGGRGKILIVDDEPQVLDLLSQILSCVGGFDTEIASDGLEGLSKVRASDYDVVFTDLSMPRLNGMEFLKTWELAIAELKRCSGTQFDPEVVRAFLATSIGKEGPE